MCTEAVADDVQVGRVDQPALHHDCEHLAHAVPGRGDVHTRCDVEGCWAERAPIHADHVVRAGGEVSCGTVTTPLTATAPSESVSQLCLCIRNQRRPACALTVLDLLDDGGLDGVGETVDYYFGGEVGVEAGVQQTGHVELDHLTEDVRVVPAGQSQVS